MSSSSATETASEVSILKAANETGYFEKSTLFPGRGTIELSDAMSRHPAADMFRPIRITTCVRNFQLRDVVLDTDTLLLFKDEAKISETSYFAPEYAEKAAHVRTDRLVPLDDDCSYALVHNKVHGVYQHWLTQCLPAIDWSLRGRNARDVRLILPRLNAWQEETLALLGYDEIPRLLMQPNVQYRISRAEFSEYLNGRTSFGLCLSGQDTYRKLLRSIPPRKGESVVYVRNAHPYYGPILNEDELVSLLRRRGIYILEVGALSIPDRFNLFRQADVIIGPHGDGLADVVFCRPGALLWEFMPNHIYNGSYNNLAHAAELHYWGDHFEAVGEGAFREWTIDLNVVAERLQGISRRFADDHPQAAAAMPVASGPAYRRLTPLDELMLEFESLGDNCEFGLIQRGCGAEPLGLFRFAGIHLPVDIRLEKLLAALEADLAGLGSVDTVSVKLEGVDYPKEFVATESAYNLMYHTFVAEDEIEAEVLRKREAVRLGFLRRKLLEDLMNGEKIWVWKSNIGVASDRVARLVAELRRRGPNILLWVVKADVGHPPGTVERIADDWFKGYVERFAPYGAANDISLHSWLEVCQATYNLCRPAAAEQDAVMMPEAPAEPLTAMDYLARSVPAAAPYRQPTAQPSSPSPWLRRLGWMRKLMWWR